MLSYSERIKALDKRITEQDDIIREQRKLLKLQQKEERRLWWLSPAGLKEKERLRQEHLKLVSELINATMKCLDRGRFTDLTI